MIGIITYITAVILTWSTYGHTVARINKDSYLSAIGGAYHSR